MAFTVDEEHISKAEQALGRQLPVELKQRLRRNNGGDLATEDADWILFPVYDPTDRKRIARTANHIVRENESWRQWSGFPEGAIAIASDGEGNALVILVGSDEVLAWNHETRQCQPVHLDWD
ncbi:SMI1/KNR4 family protein [Luteibacter aegosomatissinici]|uniref:SMI1/KNR4 family protein n=1 Tax=Luteibacter aegosomatissinici TaxID=2911539 RepID=UPI001FFAF30D|nr:SMI1/KNR4 family protein [Luteibacter aegosomatissinici]UPG96507.1 SMI1/KNR4 family protein [Luteibacter aegosomatissinici]